MDEVNPGSLGDVRPTSRKNAKEKAHQMSLVQWLKPRSTQGGELDTSQEERSPPAKRARANAVDLEETLDDESLPSATSHLTQASHASQGELKSQDLPCGDFQSEDDDNWSMVDNDEVTGFKNSNIHLKRIHELDLLP